MFQIKQTRYITPSTGFFLLICFVGAGLLLGTLAAAGIWVGITGKSVFTIEKDMLNPAYVNAARIIQLVSSALTLFVPAIGGAMLMSGKPFTWLGFKEGFNNKQIILVITIMFLCFPLVGALGEVNKIIPIPKSWEIYFTSLENKYNGQVEAMAKIRSFSEFIISLIILALLPAIFEEALFRGGFQQLLTGWFKNPITAIIVTSIFFSAIHMSYYGFLARFALGVGLGLIFYFSKSIWLSISAHFLNNGIAVSYMYYLSLHGKPVKDLSNSDFPIWLAIPSTILLVLAFKQFKQISFKRNINKIPPIDAPSVTSHYV